MSSHQTAKTRYVTSGKGIKFAYRRLGAAQGTTLLLLTHFRGVMDTWDPILINALASCRSLILHDPPGVGLSSGETATTVRQAADDVLEFLHLIDQQEIDVLGFSLGGFVAQLVALNADPAVLKVRKLVLAGTGPSAGPETSRTPNEDVGTHAGAKDVKSETFEALFFPRTREGKTASEDFWDRIHERSLSTSGEERATFVSDSFLDGGKGLQAQGAQTGSWSNPETTKGLDGSYDRLEELRIPILVANGHDDYMVPTANSFVIQQKVPNGQFIIHPRSGHGFLFQFAAQFARDVVGFLEA
ncbi:Alpha/beta-hydrolase [Pleurostoma richardsiae]|uniref:Alpha/beta-hydrolase n=1 Tax=Pleurostoma richardsiae TaxID=41990 RepID=A0AA38S498_9PEZI|nr:Alpha/beta-hydrolase [Pleurostoma richardsiae]